MEMLHGELRGRRGAGRGTSAAETAAVTAVTAVMVLAVTALPVATATAAPVCDSAGCTARTGVTVDWGAYATPLAALGGRTLAQHLADHRAGDRRLHG